MEVSVTTATSLATNEEFPKPKNLNDNSMMKKRSITTSIFPKLNIPTSLKRKGGQKVDFERKAVIALMLQQRTWTQCEIANMNNVSQSLVSTILRKLAAYAQSLGIKIGNESFENLNLKRHAKIGDRSFLRKLRLERSLLEQI